MRTIALTAVAVLAFATTAAAQSPYRDVPNNHWAAPAVNDLTKAGIFVGEPDGTFEGTERLSRYELAVILHRFYTQQTQVAAGPSEVEVQALRDRIDQLETEVQDLYSLLEQILATQNVETSSINRRLDHVERVTEVLQTLRDRQPEAIAGPPGPQGAKSDPGATLIHTIPANNTTSTRPTLQPQPVTHEEAPTEPAPAPAPASATAPNSTEHPSDPNPTPDPDELSTLELIMLLEARGDASKDTSLIENIGNPAATARLAP